MLGAFAVASTVGAFLVAVGGFHMGQVALCAGIALAVIAVVYRTKQALIRGSIIAIALSIGAFAVVRMPQNDLVLGNRAFVARVVSISTGGSTRKITIRDADGVRYSAVVGEPLLPGDKISIRGIVSAPEDFISNTTGRTVHYEKLLEARRIDATIANPQVVQIASGAWWNPTRVFARAQLFFTSIYSTYITYPLDAVVAGMVLGVQGGITSVMKTLFLNTGTLHVLVLSGYNITLVAGLIGTLFRAARPKIKMFAMFLGIAFLVGISGAGVAALRAGIMGAISLVALLTRRAYDPLRALLFAYLFFFFLNPLEIFYDPSFHLSFLATVAIIDVYPRIESRLITTKNARKREVQTLFLLSFFMPLWMLPYGIYFSGVIALSSPIANIFAALLVSIITILGLVLLAFSWIVPLAGLIGSAVSILVALFLWLLRLCAHIPIWNAPPLSWWCMLGIYIAIVGIIRWKLPESNEDVATLVQPQTALLPLTNQSQQENQ